MILLFTTKWYCKVFWRQVNQNIWKYTIYTSIYCSLSAAIFTITCLSRDAYLYLTTAPRPYSQFFLWSPSCSFTLVSLFVLFWLLLLLCMSVFPVWSFSLDYILCCVCFSRSGLCHVITFFVVYVCFSRFGLCLYITFFVVYVCFSRSGRCP